MDIALFREKPLHSVVEAHGLQLNIVRKRPPGKAPKGVSQLKLAAKSAHPHRGAETLSKGSPGTRRVLILAAITALPHRSPET